MILDNLVFGHEVFRINDLELFLTSNGRTENENRFLTLAAKNDLGGNTSNIFNQPVPITTCYDITVEGDQGQLSSGIPPGGRADYSYSDVICFTSYLWIEFIANNPVITLPSTGTGGGSWWQDEHNGCTSLPNGCGQPAQGWQPFAEGFDFMENYYQLGYQHFEFSGVSPIDEQQIEKWTNYHLNKNGLDTCRKQLLDKLLNTSSTIPIGKILTKLARAISAPNNLEKMNIRFNIKPNLGTVAKTDSFLFNSTTKVFSCAITIDSATVSKATDIFIAGTFLHEAIHAYMTYLLIRRKNGTTATGYETMTYDSVFNEYIDTLVASNRTQLQGLSTNPQYEHNFMANHLLEYLADGLREFDGNAINDERYYWYLAWKGLYATNTCN